MCNEKESLKSRNSESKGWFIQAFITKILPENKHVMDNKRQQ